jgi:hypothetical protein
MMSDIAVGTVQALLLPAFSLISIKYVIHNSWQLTKCIGHHFVGPSGKHHML